MTTAENLSPEEIIELTQAMDAGVESGRPDRTKEVKSYDFLHPDKLSKSHLRVIRYVLSGLEKSWSTTISAAVRNEAVIALNSLEQAGFRRYVDSCVLPGASAVIRVPTLSTNAVLDMPAELALSLIDRLTGGRGKASGDPRELTQIERRILKRLADRMVEDFAAVWKPITKLSAELVAFHHSPEDSGIDEGTMVLAAGFALTIGSENYRLNLAIPLNAFDAIRDALTPQNWCKGTSCGGSTPSAPVVDLLDPVSVHTEVELGRARVSMQDLVGLGIGDVIRLDRTVGEHLEVKIGGSVKFYGLPGLAGNKMAIRITDVAMESAAAPGTGVEQLTGQNLTGKETIVDESDGE